MLPPSSSIASQQEAPSAPAAVTAIVTAFARPEQTRTTLEKLLQCSPAPAEILVHVDGGNHKLAASLRQAFPTVRVIVSEHCLGPGGARNRLIEEAREELVASFDDDSHPADADYFLRVVEAARASPDAAVIAATILDELAVPPPPRRIETAGFVGCGCVCRRSVFLQTSGYVPLPLAYGMEEADLSLRLHALGRRIVHDPSLRVVHEKKFAKCEDEAVAAAMVSNVALLAWLRYPVILWPIGMAQVLRKALEILFKGEIVGVIRGLLSIPALLWRERGHRTVLNPGAVLAHIRLRWRSAPEETQEAACPS